MYKKIIALIAFVWWLCGIGIASNSFSLLMKFDKDTSLKDYISSVSHVHFGFSKNNFWGFFVFSTAENNDEAGNNSQGTKIDADGKDIFCKRKLNGLYYNSQRGDILWPLSDESKFGSDYVTLTGGLYTSCSGDNVNPYDIYGYLEHTYKKGTDQERKYWLMAWVKYNAESWSLLNDTASFWSTFGRFDNRYPVGLIYDNNGWIGFVGCTLNGTEGQTNELVAALNDTQIESVFEYTGEKVQFKGTWGVESDVLDCSNIGLAIDQLLLLKIQGIIGISKDMKGGLENLAGNEANSKTQFFSSVNVNNATLINTAKKNAEQICAIDQDTTDVICKSGDQTYDITALNEKTLVVNGGDLTLQGQMNSSNEPLDIFINGGNLILDLKTGHLTSFTEDGFPVYNGGNETKPVAYTGIYLKGNFIVNGLVQLATWTENEKYFIHGKFTSLNTYDIPTPQRKQQIQTVLNNPSISNEQINLTKVFKWRCNLGSGTDGSACTVGEFKDSPLSIINQNYPSKILNG